MTFVDRIIRARTYAAQRLGQANAQAGYYGNAHQGHWRAPAETFPEWEFIGDSRFFEGTQREMAELRLRGPLPGIFWTLWECLDGVPVRQLTPVTSNTRPVLAEAVTLNGGIEPTISRHLSFEETTFPVAVDTTEIRS